MSTATPPVPPSPKVAQPGAPADPNKAANPADPSNPAAGEVPPEELEPKKKIPWAKWFALSSVASLTGTGISVLLHAILIALGIALIPPLRNAVVDLMAPQEQVIVPTAELATEQVGGIPNPGMNSDASRAAAQAVDSSVSQSDAFSETKSETLTQTLSSSAAGDATPSVIGVGPQKSGSSNGMGSGATGGGSLAKFGVPGGGSGIGPKGAVFGNGGNALRIAFICDGTGTMITKMALLKRELNNTLGKLKPRQVYDVIFFYDGENVAAVDKTQLLNATPPNNKKTATFLDSFAPQGKTNPLPAIDLAFKLKPQLVYFLSDGAFDDLVPYDQVVAKFKDLNKDKSARVNTIIFQNAEDPDLTKAINTMKKIASDNGGNFVEVDPIKLLTQ